MEQMTISPAVSEYGNDIIPLRSLKLIGIHGHAGAGKDTVASYIQSRHQDCYIESFAGPLKRACAAAFGLSPEEFNNREWKEQETFWGATPRKIAQFVGTEMFRQHAADLYSDFSFANTGNSHWINLLEARLTGISFPPEGEGHYEPGDTVIIPDVRFQDEAHWIWNNGGVLIHLTREGCEGKVGLQGHASEAGISFFNSPPGNRSYRIENNSTLGDLYATVDSFIHFYRDYLSLKLEPEYEPTTGKYKDSDF
jgi:hypothetical protein